MELFIDVLERTWCTYMTTITGMLSPELIQPAAYVQGISHADVSRIMVRELRICAVASRDFDAAIGPFMPVRSTAVEERATTPITAKAPR